MDNSDTNENNEPLTNSEPEESHEELSHSDKMIGVFTEPGKTFDNASKFPPRTKDWVLPLVILLALGVIFSIPAWNLFKHLDDKYAKQLMFASFLYLPLAQLAFLFA